MARGTTVEPESVQVKLQVKNFRWDAQQGLFIS
jgi:hypothetical protein